MSPAMARHLASCAACRGEVERMDAALHALVARLPERTLSEEEFETRVMSAVRLMPAPRRELLSVRDWIIAGCAVLLSMALIPVGGNFGLFIAVAGVSYALPLALVLGVGITLYSALFVGTHVDTVLSFVRRRIVRQI